MTKGSVPEACLKVGRGRPLQEPRGRPAERCMRIFIGKCGSPGLRPRRRAVPGRKAERFLSFVICPFSFDQGISRGMKITYYLEVLSSWCYWAEPAWSELQRRLAEQATFNWKIALMDASGLPQSREQ